MNLFEKRYSCRSYDSRQVENEKLLKVLEAVRLAPSAVNRQPWTFLVVNDEAGRRAVIESYEREWIKSAPLYIIAFGHHDKAWHRPHDNKDHTDIDVAIAVEHLCLAATEQGLGTCWVCNFNPKIIRKKFLSEKNDDLEPIAIIPIGYPSAESKEPQKLRKELDEIVKWNTL